MRSSPRVGSAPKEYLEQIALFDWARCLMVAEPRLALLYHIPNGEKRDKATAARLQRMGVIPGVPDVCLPVASRTFHGTYLELKATRGTASEAQQGWLNSLSAHGYCAGVYHGWLAAARHLCWYLEREDLTRQLEGTS
jgi:hypothetical protein